MKKGCHIKASIWYFCLFTLSSQSHTYGQIPQTNIRELCRKRVSGIYLTSFDKNERAKALIEITQQKLKQLEKPLFTAKKQLESLKQKEKYSKFDLETNNKIDQTSDRIKQIENTIVDQKKLYESAKKDYKESSVHMNGLKTKIEKVFNFVKVNNSAGYKFTLEYRDKCPKFRFVCPLPKESSELLLKIFDNKQVPESCLKYSGHY
ncbi:MAG: hypothetical protein R3B45_14835 [Bdellovibrionota bacterium]